MRIYSNQNVFDAALERIRWLFSEFPQVVLSYSGGKDSTVVFHLALQVARELGRLPLKVLWLDQEAEWQATVDIAREVMTHPDVEPMWFQIPMVLFNATSTHDHWLRCWYPEDEEKWMRPREDYAYTENVYGTERFVPLFKAILQKEFKGTKTCVIAGVRCEESPVRELGLTYYKTYKWATWGQATNKRLGHYTMYPIYDWSYTDVWAAIHKNKWSYNRIYDAQYSYGIPVHSMRVSNVHHETAVSALFYMQELEPETYDKLVARVPGIDTAGKLGKDDYFITDLPPAFSSWKEYRDYLLENLITNPEWREGMRKNMQKQDALYGPHYEEKVLCKIHISSILTNDWEGIKLHNFHHSPKNTMIRKKIRGGDTW